MSETLDLNDIPVFLKVAETGSFTAAAEALGLRKATVSRRVARLELAMGVRLIQRTTRSLSLTDAGRQYYRECSEAFAAIRTANRRTAEAREEPRGTIRLSAPADSGFLSEAISEFLIRYPKVSMEIILTDQYVNVVEEGIDIAIRAGSLTDSSLVARKLGTSRRAFVASPAYLEARRTPETPDDLAEHDCIIFGGAVEGAGWTVDGPDGPRFVAVRARVAVNTMRFALRAAVAGLGIALIPSPIAAADVRAGRLATVLDPYQPPHGGLYILYPSTRHMPAAVRVFGDFLFERMAWLRASDAPVSPHDAAHPTRRAAVDSA
ncbi:MAG: LysR family transcriptional regulator [Bauldia sp.]|nr:LysR family transcriptional regulator [Bauldia sp.]